VKYGECEVKFYKGMRSTVASAPASKSFIRCRGGTSLSTLARIFVDDELACRSATSRSIGRAGQARAGRGIHVPRSDSTMGSPTPISYQDDYKFIR
jgi:hypothetical protein